MTAEALDQLSDWTQAGGTDWGLGVEARSRALLNDGEQADRLYREAIARLGRTGMRPELARVHLLYGEWLRRQRRSVDARAQLRTARQLLDAIGMEAFAERARRELLAAGGYRPQARRHRQGGTDRAGGADRPRRRRRSPGWPPTGCRTRRSPPGCSCPRARSSTTWARSSPSWTSPRASSSAAPCLAAETPRSGQRSAGAAASTDAGRLSWRAFVALGWAPGCAGGWTRGAPGCTADVPHPR